VVAGHAAVAIAVGGTVAVLLHLKPQMHALAARIGDRDFKAIMQFALISLVILPVLPNRAYGPLQVWNSFKIWLAVRGDRQLLGRIAVSFSAAVAVGLLLLGVW